MANLRKFQRFPMELHAKCSFKETDSVFNCKVSEVSKEGVAIKVQLTQKINPGSKLDLEIDIPSQMKPVNATFLLIWINESDQTPGFNYLAGGELRALDPDIKADLLSYGYENWKRHREERFE